MPTHATHMHPSSSVASAAQPPPSSHAPTSTSAPAPAPRARGQGTRKRAAAADDAAYHAAVGTKRAAADRADGDRERIKRKRTDATGAASAALAAGHNAADKEEKESLVSALSSVLWSWSVADGVSVQSPGMGVIFVGPDAGPAIGVAAHLLAGFEER